MEDREEQIVFTVGEITGRQEENIRGAEVIFLLTGLIGGSMTGEEVQAVLSAHYEGYTSALVDEYRGLIERYRELAGPEPAGAE